METEISKRKSEHLHIVADENVEHTEPTLLDNVHLIHQALPEIDFDDLDLSTSFFGKKLRYPLMITSMTGGSEYSETMNHGLAYAAGEAGIAFAVGSQRVMLNHPETVEQFQVREAIGEGVLLGNIGGAQLLEYPTKVIKSLADQIEADGICVHLNPAQELVQKEGNRRFKGILEGIEKLLNKMEGKVLVKETGAGLSRQTLEHLRAIGVPYIDASGSGGTSWTKVESYRPSNKELQRTGRIFANWGIPTAVSVHWAKDVLGDSACIIGSGGIWTGLDAAKTLAMGADIAGFARSVLMVFLDHGEEGALKYIDQVIRELKVAALLSGVTNAKDMKQVPRVYTGQLREWLNTNSSEYGENVEY